jgi:hypothetical protein
MALSRAANHGVGGFLNLPTLYIQISSFVKLIIFMSEFAMKAYY